MGLKAASRVRETSPTTGTGTYTLGGASTGYRSFGTGIGVGNTCHYVATDGTGWEVGVGTVGSGTLARTTILASSNGGAAVSWTTGTRTITCTMPGEVSIPGTKKIGSFTRDLSTASGTQAVTGVGFTPRFVIFFGGINATSTVSWGIDDGTSHFAISDQHQISANTYGASASISIAAVTGSGNFQTGLITSLDADGFTVTWTKTGSPTGSFVVNYLAWA